MPIGEQFIINDMANLFIGPARKSRDRQLLAPANKQFVIDQTALVARLKIPLLFNFDLLHYAKGSTLTRNQSLEVVQSGFYWGYKELQKIIGGAQGDLGKLLEVTMPAGYHSHQPTGSTLAYGKGLNPAAYNFKWDDDVSSYNFACEKYIPFDYYMGPVTFSVKHDSIFYNQARIIIEEIQGIIHDNKKLRSVVIGGDNLLADWCPNQLKRFYIINPDPTATFQWTFNNPGLEIVSGQGTSQVWIRRNQTYSPSQHLVITIAGESDCFRYNTQQYFENLKLVDYETIIGSFQMNTVNAVGWHGIFYFGWTQTATMIGLNYINYVLVSAPPVNHGWTQNGNRMDLYSEPTLRLGNFHFRVQYNYTCDATIREVDFYVTVNPSPTRREAGTGHSISGNNLYLTMGNKQPYFTGNEVLIYDSKGSLVRKTKAYYSEGRLKIDISGVANGIYFLHIRRDKDFRVEKIFINK